ncbi:MULTISPECIES: hypothetical protein [unclassified Sphingobium]|jgi:hypothetical protein|uniref:hypothetical protein n=1 Tax=unclassified Sphingobium TaxID=2611147 RepID=UPI0007F51926|nr:MULTISPECIES: hypothetical protein [unclassified Sphingobium]OAN54730.1 hypothetical protein A7Q26_23665 [Sphingobium sp. TCM1]WIW89671.1 hypothetical protein K3M67_06870 [Sphingobium sp. V4]
MAKADRLERLDMRRAELESEYRASLIAALHVTAAGRWGLFAHQKDKAAIARTAPVIAALTELATEIDAMRDTLGLEPFDLHRDFMAARGPAAADAVGEPRQAGAWLQRMGATTD